MNASKLHIIDTRIEHAHWYVAYTRENELQLLKQLLQEGV